MNNREKWRAEEAERHKWSLSKKNLLQIDVIKYRSIGLIHIFLKGSSHMNMSFLSLSD
jgi:hypothetical protein